MAGNRLETTDDTLSTRVPGSEMVLAVNSGLEMIDAQMRGVSPLASSGTNPDGCPELGG